MTKPPALRRLASDLALLLDFDGTLVPFASRPDAVVAAPYLTSLLLRVRASLAGALGLVSGRSIQDLDRLAGWSVMAVAGLHGLERRNANGIVVQSGEAHIARLAPLRLAVKQFQMAHPAVLIEDKGASLALHYRRAPVELNACLMFAEMYTSRADNLEIMRGDQVVEIKPVAENKGTAVGAFLEEYPFKGRRPVFVGDDITDEDAFAEVQRRAGISIIVGNRQPTHATYRLPSVQAVHTWLSEING